MHTVCTSGALRLGTKHNYRWHTEPPHKRNSPGSILHGPTATTTVQCQVNHVYCWLEHVLPGKTCLVPRRTCPACQVKHDECQVEISSGHVECVQRGEVSDV